MDAFFYVFLFNRSVNRTLNKQFLNVCQSLNICILYLFLLTIYGPWSVKGNLKDGPSDLGTKIFHQNSKKSSLYSQSLLIFIHKTPVVESHPKTRETRDLLRPRSTPSGNTIYFYMRSLVIYLHTENTQTKLQT